MELLTLILSIAIAYLLLVRVIAPPYAPVFSRAERLPRSGMLLRAHSIAKAGRITERGRGINVGKLRRDVTKCVKKSEAVNASVVPIFSIIARGGSALTKAALWQGLRRAHLIGHVRGVPRLFALCDGYVRANVAVDISSLFDCLAEFYKTAPLEIGEAELLPDMLKYCLCGQVVRAAMTAARLHDRFSAGETDGRAGRIDLDRLRDMAYAVGLNSTLGELAERIFGENGVEICELKREFLRHCATLTATADMCIRSLDIVDGIDRESLLRFCGAHNELADDARYARLCYEDKLKALKRVSRYARKNKTDEISAVRALIENNSAYIFAAPRDFSNIAVRAAAAAVTAVAVALSAFYSLYSLLSLPVVYLAAKRLAVFIYGVIKYRYFAAEVRLSPRCFAAWQYVVDKITENMEKVSGKKSVFDVIDGVAALAAPMFEAALFIISAATRSSLLIALSLALPISEMLVAAYLIAELSPKPYIDVAAAFVMWLLAPTVACYTAFLLTAKHERRLTHCAVIAGTLSQLGVGIASLTLSILFGGVFAAVFSGLIVLCAAFPLFYGVKVTVPIALRESKVHVDGKSSEAFYFDGESGYAADKLAGELDIACDTRGGVFLCGKRADIFCQYGGERFDLRSCDGAFCAGGAVYRALTPHIDFCARFAAPADAPCLAARVRIINRTGERLSVTLRAALDNGEAFIHLPDDERDACEVSGERAIDISPYSLASCTAYFSKRTGRRLFDYTAAGGYFDYALSSCKAYFDASDALNNRESAKTMQNKALNAAMAEFGAENGFVLNREYCVPHDNSERLIPSDIECDITLSYGGIVGDKLVSDLSRTARRAVFRQKNTVYFSDGTYSGAPQFFVCLSCGEIFSPTVYPLGRGELTVGIGENCTYKCRFGGFECELDRYTVDGGELFDLTVKNSGERDYSIMLAAVCEFSEYREAFGSPRKYCFVGRDGGFGLLCSRDISDRTAYREGYCKYGRIDKTSGFRRRGETIAPAISVDLCKGVERVAFFVAKQEGCIDDFDLAAADAYIKKAKAIPRPITLMSSDVKLNYAFAAAANAVADSNFELFGAEGYIALRALRLVDEKRAAEMLYAWCGALDNECVPYGDCRDKIPENIINRAFILLAAKDICDINDVCALKTGDINGIFGYATGQTAGKLLFAADMLAEAAERNRCADVAACAVIYGALNGFSRLVCDRKRKKRYREACSRIRAEINAKRGNINFAAAVALKMFALAPAELEFAADNIGMTENIITAAALYACGDKAAFSVLKSAIDALYVDGFDKMYYGAGKSVIAPLLYCVIAEGLLGISRRSEVFTLRPRPDDAPHIEFALNRGGKRTHIVVDESRGTSAWQVSCGRVTYQTDRLKVGELPSPVVMVGRG